MTIKEMLLQELARVEDDALLEKILHLLGNSNQGSKGRMSIESIGWSKDQAIETRMRFRIFEDAWNASGMEAYDDM